MTLTILSYSFLATVTLLLSAGLGAFFKMSRQTISLLQHLTAGIVFAAVATELLPKILEIHSPFHITIGFGCGVALMVLIKTLTGKAEASDQFSLSLFVGVGTDLFIDGLLMAVSFLSGEQTGRLIAFALVLEVAFLALSLSTNLMQSKLSFLAKTGVFLLLSLLIPFGAMSGALILAYLPASFFTALLSFGAAALLYLVTEELLTEAHEIKDTPLTTSAFFIGFLVIFLFKD